MGCRRSPFFNMGTTLAVIQSISVVLLVLLRLGRIV